MTVLPKKKKITKCPKVLVLSKRTQVTIENVIGPKITLFKTLIVYDLYQQRRKIRNLKNEQSFPPCTRTLCGAYSSLKKAFSSFA